MKSKNEKPNKDDLNSSIKEENELLKLKLTAERGAQFGGQSNLSPEAENQWLKYIQAFEKKYEDVKKIKVYDKIGRPAYQKAEDLTGEQITRKLDELLDLMNRNEVVLDVSGDYEDRVIYRFITEELFDYVMDDLEVELPGMFTHFHYEEFHPNPLLDAQDALEDLFRGLSEKWEPQFSVWRLHESEFKDHSGSVVSDSKELEKRYELLQQTIRSLTIEKIDQEKIEQLSDDLAVYSAKIKYWYVAEGEQTKQHYEGAIELELKPSMYAPMWGVTGLKIPGIKF